MLHNRSSLTFLSAIVVSALGGLALAPRSDRADGPASAMPSAADVAAAAGEGTSLFADTMADMTWQEIEKAAEDGAIVLMTTAVIEEHGPHMGCGIDAYLGHLTCRLVRTELESRGVKTVIAPPLYWGINGVTHTFPGTFTVREETMKALIHDVLASLKSWGFRDVFNINAHGDGQHIAAGIRGIVEARKELEVDARYLLAREWAGRLGLTGNEPFALVHDAPPSGIETQEHLDLHAGAAETGIVAGFLPEQVDVELARTLEPTRIGLADLRAWATDARQVTPLGYLGDPASFDVAKARKDLVDECRMIADAIERALED